MQYSTSSSEDKPFAKLALLFFFPDFVGVLTGDDNLTVFADGRLVGYNSGSWTTAKWFSFPCKTKTIAVSVSNDRQGYGGFLGVFSNGVVTDGSWKCKETNTPENGWQDANFTDHAWPDAYTRYNNTGNYGVMGIPPNIGWISSANHKASRFICRRRFNTEERTSNSSKLHYNDNDFQICIVSFFHKTL